MITLPKELNKAILASRGEPIRLADPETHDQYVVLRAAVYDQIQGFFYEGTSLTNDEKRDLLVKAGLRAAWDDPEMDAYDELDPRKAP